MQLQQVPAPRLQFHVQPIRPDLISCAIVRHARQVVRQPPRFFLQVVPCGVYMALSGGATEIDHNEISSVFTDPVPSHKVAKTRVIGPPGTLAKAPLAVPEYRALQG